MESTLATILIVMGLLVGVGLGAVAFPGAETIKEVEKEVIVEVPVEVPVETVVEVEIPAVNQLELATAAFMQAVEEEEDEAGNNVDVLGKYDFDEVEISKVYSDYTVVYDDDKTIIEFSIKLKFDEEDEPSHKEIYDVTVTFEEDEDTEVLIA